ncbi:hypothetical protein WMF39_18730 [Sorangium sp. So ce1504]|uniref:hypothetical protein n=1 Tax=Sorangium sp. So ce1504 TaxID=3133337 RepID=UPI003F5F413F
MASKSAQGFLWVPLRLQAMCLDAEQDVVRAMADYRKLPFIAGGQTYNGGTPNLSEKILSPPFTKGLPLPPGIHLHWFLPSALTQGEQEQHVTRFPEVPSRFLILRSGGGQPERQWVVESDYLHPEGHGDDIGGEAEAPVNVMVVPDPAPARQYRFRFLGRALTLDAWRKAQEAGGHESLAALTAVGSETEVPALDPVRASFASFYPNCRTVFGFHDPDFPTRTPPQGLRYDVIGWYSDPARDCLAPLLAEANSPAALKALLEEKMQWALDAGGALPQATLFHARLAFAPGARAARDRVRELPRPTLAVGQTETEALAALLAYRRAPDDNDAALAERRLVEDQLEALQLTERIEGHQLDLDARLFEARHERGFAARSAGIRWSIQPLSNTATDLFSSLKRRAGRTSASPPPAWAELLEALNLAEEAHQRGLEEIEALRQRMYARWHIAANQEEVIEEPFFQAHVVPVRHQLTRTGRLHLEQEPSLVFRARAEPISFEIVSRQCGQYDTYVEVLGWGEPFNLEDEDDQSNWTWVIEFRNCCELTLSESHEVKVVTPDERWEIHNEGITYTVRALAEGLSLEIPASDDSLAGKLASALMALQDAISAYNATPAGAAAPYVLRRMPATPYWEAANPVLLLTGEAARNDLAQDRAGSAADGDLLACSFLDAALDLQALPEATVTALASHLAGLGPEVGSTWKEPPWSPFTMHWYFKFAPSGREGNGDYDPGQLLEHYTLETQAVDQALRPGHESSFAADDNIYSGISLLTPSASREVEERISLYLQHELLPAYFAAHGVPAEEQNQGYLAAHFAEIQAWYLSQSTPEPGTEDPVFTALWAYGELQKTPCLAQALGNFNDVLLLREPVMQLKISDPLAPIEDPDDWDAFYADTVRNAMGGGFQRRPLTLDRFNALRSGAMSITGLWLVDTFGQVKEVVDIETPGDIDVITTVDQTPPAGVYHQVLLSPRLSQPARLRFEWLPADSAVAQRTNDHPETNPVCGFLLVNNLDGALAVYDKAGRALGSIDRTNTWRTAPGSGGRVRMGARGMPQLYNVHLQRVVEHVLQQDAEFLKRFLSTQRTALETIDPEAYAENPSRALLMARPVAVVRAALTLELKGPPALDPTTLVDDEDTSRGIEALKIPVRLGEFSQLDDGLVGYFREEPAGQRSYTYGDGVFYSPQERDVGHALIRTYGNNDGSMYMLRTAADPAQHVTMLLDPRGQVHATTGVLPSEQLRLSPEHYSKALAAMEVSFLTAPILTDRGALRLPVPEEAGHTWSWTTQEPTGDWAETSALAPVNPRAAFSAPQEVREGWLMLRRSAGQDN